MCDEQSFARKIVRQSLWLQAIQGGVRTCELRARRVPIADQGYNTRRFLTCI